MKKLMFTLAAASLAGLVQADWIQTGAGPYDYNDPENWSDRKPNGVFPATLTLEGEQTIIFSADTEISTGLTIAYAGNQPMTFVSDGTGAKTLTLGGPIALATANNGKAAHVTFGSETEAQNLVLDLGGAEREFSSEASQDNPANIGWLNLYAKLTNGAVKYAGKGTFKVYGANDYADGTLLANTGYVYANHDAAFGTGLITVKNDSSAWARLQGDVAVTIANPWRFEGKFGYHTASAVTWTGDITIPAPFAFMTENASLSIKSEKIVDDEGKCAIGNFQKFGSKDLKLYTPLTVDHTEITMGDGVWRFYGKISGDSMSFVGPSGNGFVHFESENDFTGTLTVRGTSDKMITVSFQVEGSLPSGLTSIRLEEHGNLQSSSKYSCAALINSGLIDPASTGALCIGATGGEKDTVVDFTAYPNLYFGAAGGNQTFNGRLIAGSNGYHLGGGPNYLTLGAANVLSGKHDVDLQGQVTINNACDLEGTITIPNNATFILATASNTEFGQVPNADIVVGRYATLQLNANRGSEYVRARNITLKGGYLDVRGNTNAATNQKISGDIIVSEELGGYPIIKMTANAKYDVALSCRKIDLSGPAVLGVQGLGLGATPGANTCHIYTEERPTLVGGNGAPGTTTISIVPQMIGGTTANGAESGSYAQSFVTYEDAVGFRPLDLETEYVQGAIPTEGTQHNVRLLGWETRELAASATINALLLQSKDVTSGLVDTLKLAEGAPEGTALMITSGQLISGQRKQKTTMISAPIDFGSAHGMVTYGAYIYTYFDSPFAGSGGMTLVQSVLKQNNVRYASFCGKSSFTGDVYALSDIGFENGFLPDDKARSGSFHLSYLANCSHPSMTINALDGDGAIAANNSDGAILTLGMDGADGDYIGRIGSDNGTGSGSKYWIVKKGAGRQRLGGRCTQWQPVTVEAGVLQVDGEFTNVSKTTVKAAATLAGSGSFHDGVTLEDGAKLEAGSLKSDDDQVMNLDGGLTLKGAATLDLVAKDKLTVGSVAVKGALTIPADKVVTVNVLLAKDAQGKDVKLKGPAQHVVFAAESPLTLANFKRGTNCGPLTLSQDGTQVLMSVQNGFVVIVR